MPKAVSQRRISLILNGHQFEGWSTSDAPVKFPGVDLLEIQRGRDGTMYASDTGNRGGEMQVMLHPTSISAQRCAKWWGEHAKDADLNFSGIYNDPDLGISLSLRGGKMRNAPPIPVQGEDYQATWDFEEMVPNVDGGTPNEPPRRVGT